MMFAILQRINAVIVENKEKEKGQQIQLVSRERDTVDG